jgi:Hypothetical glycosyl hydrolase family 15
MKSHIIVCASLALTTMLAALPSQAQNSPPDGGVNSVASRIANRNFPSVFAPWNVAENLRQADGQIVPLSTIETPAAIRARHDLFFSTYDRLGLKLASGRQYVLLTPDFTPESIQAALDSRARLLAANPHMLIMTDVHYFSAPKRYLPADSPWWKHDARNAQFEGNNLEYKSSMLDFSNPEFQDKVAALAAALMKTGVFDGCMLDWWHDNDKWAADRLTLVKKIREAIGEKAILLGNVNGVLPTHTARYLNGMYMEGFGTQFFPDWHTAAANLLWGASHLRQPAFTALEGWYSYDSENGPGDENGIQRQGRANFARMREITTLSLVFSDGYVLFSDPNSLPTPDHLHDWYPFWDKSLGKPVAPVAKLDRPDLSGAYTRQYEKGQVVFNPPSNHAVTINFPEPRRSAATGNTGKSFSVAAGDGDIYTASR